VKCTGSGSGGDTKAGFDIGNADDAKQSDPHKPGPMLAVVGTRCDNRWSAEVKEKQWDARESRLSECLWGQYRH